MATPEELLSLLSFNDLARFEQSAQASDIYGQAGQALASAPINYSQFSPMETGITAFGKAFLSGLLQNYGRNQIAEQTSAVVGALPQLSKDPYTAQTPEGVDPQAFSMLRGTAILNKARSEAESKSDRAKDLRDMFKTVLGEGIKSGVLEPEEAMSAIETGKLPTKVTGESTAKSNPNSPIEKKATELKNKFESLEEVQNYKYVQRLSNQLVETLKNPSAVADPILAKMVVQFVEPKLSVNSGEAAGLAASTSIPEAWKGYISKALEGGTSLPPEVRAGLLDIAKAGYFAHQKAFATTAKYYESEAKRFGVDPARVNYLGTPIGFEEFTGAKTYVTITNPKTGNSFKVPADDPRLKLLGTPRG